ncbi:MAG: hypothetical protein ACD_58C00343G0004 [uncultured bacterium]|nr:MAG: hypothetical protein ACD_58C00343G0004 [uncultured bacterium]
MSINIDHAKTAREAFFSFYDKLIGSIKLRKRLVGKIEKLRVILTEHKEIFIKIANDEYFIMRAIQILNKCQLNYSDLRPTVEILIYCSNFIRFIDKNILLRTRPVKLVTELKKIFTEIFMEIEFEFTKADESTRTHVIKHLESLVAIKPENIHFADVAATNLRKINKGECFSLIYLVRAREAIDKIVKS